MSFMIVGGKSYLLVGTEYSEKDIFGQVPIIDRLIVDGENLNIKTARELVRTGSLRPFGDRRVILILKSEAMSVEVQNTLLKLIEEPPKFLSLILQAASSQLLLGTIRSRAEKIVLEKVSAQSQEVIEDQDFLKDRGRAEKYVAEIKDRPQLIELLSNEAKVVKSQFFKQPDATLAKKIELLDRAIVRLKANSNWKLTYHWLVLHWFEN